MDLLKNFTAFIKNEHLFSPKDKLLIAVSGGVDSVVLCELCKLSAYEFIIAHCNFQLRGKESERDEEFVQDLGKKYGVEVFVKHFDTEKYAAEHKLSIQVAARELRYHWFHEMIDTAEKGSRLANYILTAHHAGDNIETLLMNFFKGTGISGLRGILPKQGKIIRPLLFAGKSDLVKFAEDHQLSFVEDSSNASDKYSRNYFRNQLIPAIKQLFPRVEENLKENLQRFREIEIIYRQWVDWQKKQLMEQKGNEFHIPVLKLKKTKPLSTVLYEIIKDFGFTAHQIPVVMSLMDSETGKYVQSFNHRIIRNRNWLIISPNDSREAENIPIGENDQLVSFPGGKIAIQLLLPTKNYELKTSNYIAQLDASKIQFPLLLRKWKQGDYFYPLGMKKKKKISRFLIDGKLSLTQKEKIWVVESDKKIIWLMGQRIDERFKLTGRTGSILQLSLIVA